MPRYSVIIPAFNEAAFLPKTLGALSEAMKATSAAGEVIVADNNSTDQTATIARKFGAKVAFEPINQIARARNRGAMEASPDAEFLIFLDADTLLPPETLREALDALESGDCCGGGAVVQTDHPLPFLVDGLLKTWNRVAGWFGWAAGCFVFCRREGFEAIGGFDERYYASEEIWFSKQLKRWGKKRGLTFNVLSGPPVVTSDRKAGWFSTWEFLGQLGRLFFNPWAARSRRQCSMWYQRPQPKDNL